MGELIPILGIIFTIGVPSVALATHLVLRPLVRDIIKAMNADRSVEDGGETQRRLAELEANFNQLNRQVGRLLEAERFRRELESGER